MVYNTKLIYSIAVSVLFTACNYDKSHDQTENTAEEHKSNEIVIEPDDQAAFGIKTQLVTPQAIRDVIHATGTISGDMSHNAAISAPTNGILTLTPAATPGSEVTKGIVIARISSKGVAGGDSNAAALARLKAAKVELDRIKPLLPDGIVTKREYEAALAEYESAKAGYSGAAASGIVSSPINGRISQILAKTGEYVTAGTSIAVISDNASKLLKVDIPEKYRSEAGSFATANIRAASSDEWIPLDSIGNIRKGDLKISPDASSGYFNVYFKINNPNYDLLDGSMVEVAILSQNTNGESIVLPREALMEQQGNYFVYVKTGEHSFEKRAVEPGESDGIVTYINEGLKSGDEVVVSGTTMVRLAANRNVVPEGHSHNH